ncbi:MAG: OapB/ArvB family protein [Candidatus Kariarchaeaceae archaeon]|jgi:hypothetical protein
MTQIEFITSSRVAGMDPHNLYDFILDRILEDRIVVLEKEMDAEEQMELIARGLEKVNTDDGMGINFLPFYITTHVAGLLRNRMQDVQFNLITPGSSKISETKEGHYSVETQDGQVFSAAF